MLGKPLRSSGREPEADVDGGDGQEEYFPAYELAVPWLSHCGLQDTVGFHTDAFYFGN